MSQFDENPLGVMLTAIIVVSIGFGYLTGGGGAPAAETTTFEVTGGAATIDTGALESVSEVTTVTTSLDDAVAFDGDGYIEADLPDVHEPGPWSVCTYAAADSSTVAANRTETVLAYDQALLRYNGSEDEYAYVWFNQSGRHTVRAAATVTEANATKLLPVCAIHESHQLQVVTNTTNGTAVGSGAENFAYPSDTAAWNGTVEETRGYDGALNRTQQTMFFDAPTQAVRGAPPAFRLTYDTRGDLGGSVPVYFASGDATVTNASQVAGFADPGVSRGSDYSVSGATIEILDGALEPDGEVLYIEYQLDEGPTTLLGIGIALFALAVLYIPLRGLLR